MHTRLYTLKDKANTAKCPQLLSKSGGCGGILGAIFFFNLFVVLEIAIRKR